MCGKVGCASHGARDGDDELTHAHANRTHKQEVSTTHLLNEIEPGHRAYNIDSVGDDLDGKGIFEAGSLEIGGAIIENEVHAFSRQSEIKAVEGSMTYQTAAAEPEASNRS